MSCIAWTDRWHALRCVTGIPSHSQWNPYRGRERSHHGSHAWWLPISLDGHLVFPGETSGNGCKKKIKHTHTFSHLNQLRMIIVALRTLVAWYAARKVLLDVIILVLLWPGNVIGWSLSLTLSQRYKTIWKYSQKTICSNPHESLPRPPTGNVTSVTHEESLWRHNCVRLCCLYSDREGTPKDRKRKRKPADWHFAHCPRHFPVWSFLFVVLFYFWYIFIPNFLGSCAAHHWEREKQ